DPHAAVPRDGAGALARRGGRVAHARAAQADRPDGALERADADQPARRRGALQRPAGPAAELETAVLSRARTRVRAHARQPGRLKRRGVCTYHLRPFAPPWQKNSSSPKNRRSPPTSRARSAASRARATTSRATNM